MQSKFKQISQQMLPMIDFATNTYPTTLSFLKIIQQIDWSLLQYLEKHPFNTQDILTPENIKDSLQVDVEPFLGLDLYIMNSPTSTTSHRKYFYSSRNNDDFLYSEPSFRTVIDADEKTTSKWWWTGLQDNINIAMLNNKSDNLYLTDYRKIKLDEIDSEDIVEQHDLQEQNLQKAYREQYKSRPMAVKLLSNRTYTVNNEDFTTKELYALLKANEVAQELKQSINYDSDLIAKIAQLIYEQTKNEIIINDDKDNKKEVTKTKQLTDEPDINEDVKHFLKTYSPNINNESAYDTLPPLTYRDFGQFLYDLKNKQPISSKFTTWMFYTIDKDNPQSNNNVDNDEATMNNEFMTTILQSMNLNNFMKLTDVNLPENAKLITELQTDSGFTDQFDIVDMYDIFDNRPIDKNLFMDQTNVQHKLLTHGTSNSSILTIIRDGLLSRQELNPDAKAEFTGLGLGNGVYFAQMYQAGKSASYTTNYYSNNPKTSYLFIADVYYSKVLETNHYGSPENQNWDLLQANGVGSYDRDELVAKSGYQVRVRKMLALKSK